MTMSVKNGLVNQLQSLMELIVHNMWSSPFLVALDSSQFLVEFTSNVAKLL